MEEYITILKDEEEVTVEISMYEGKWVALNPIPIPHFLEVASTKQKILDYLENTYKVLKREKI